MDPTSRRGAVGVHDCLTMLIVLLGGLVLARFAGEAFGWMGFLLGLPIGTVISFGVLYAIVLLWACSEALLFGGIPYLPTCGNGKCDLAGSWISGTTNPRASVENGATSAVAAAVCTGESERKGAFLKCYLTAG